MKKIINLIENKATFIKYIFVAGFSFFLDISLFTLFKFLLKGNLSTYILVATICARIISSFINYLFNRNKVFKSNNRNTLLKYYLLVVVQMFVSGLLVTLFHSLIHINETVIKIPIEVILFLINYLIQKLFIFGDKKIIMPSNLKYFIFAILIVFSLTIKLSKNHIIDKCYNNNQSLLCLLLVSFTFLLFKKYYVKYQKSNKFNFLAFIYSSLLVVGYSYDNIGSAYFVFGNISFLAISIIKISSLFIFFRLIINIIYDKLSSCLINSKSKFNDNKLIRFFNKHPFIFCTIVLLICYIPYLVAFYPAIMGYDPSNQIREFMGMHTRYMDSVILLDSNVTITNFNPVLHTLLLGGCFKIGHILGNDNLGLFMYSLISLIIVISTLSYSIYYLKNNGIKNKLLFILLGIYALVPVFPFYSITTNKDMIFCCFILLYLIKLHSLITKKQNIKDYICLIVIMIFTCLTRNNGIYTIVLSLPFTIIWLKDKRKGILISLIITLLFYGGYNKLLLPSLKITNTSIREMLSIPFQQTARHVKYYPEDFNENDRKVINKILEFDTLPERYNPKLSDPVKNKYNIYTTNKDLKEYFAVWLKGLEKRPAVYFDATINNIYGYFYPDTSSWYLYYKYNTELKKSGFNYHYNSLTGMRNGLTFYGKNFVKIPIIGLILNIGLATWIYLFLFNALIVKKKYKYIPFILPALSFILVCIAGPANTYFRYAWPYIMSMPFVIILLLQVFNQRESS